MQVTIIFLVSWCLITMGQITPPFPISRVPPLQISANFPRHLMLQIQGRGRIPVHLPSVSNLEELLENEWNSFKLKYEKNYPTLQEEEYRREVFIENLEKINRHNEKYAQGLTGFSSQINAYADMLHHEFTTSLNGFNITTDPSRRVNIPQSSAFIPSANVIFPSTVDWREVGAVTGVKNQGKCAACWAFAAAGALEGHHYRKTGDLVEVSVQNLIDCTGPYGNSGCTGGLMNPAFEYVKENNGVHSEESYTYEGRTAECSFNGEDAVVISTGYVDIAQNDEKGLEMAVATLGPVAAAIDAGKPSFQFYGNGIYDDPACGTKPEEMNHAVLIVGYGQEPDGRRYWLVKNSYGTQWGLGGYIKIAKDNGNQCGIAIQASYPLV